MLPGFSTISLTKILGPLSPENPLIFMTGPFTGLAATSPKVFIVTRSPLTVFLGKAAASGSFGPVLRKAGYNGIIIKGKAKGPVFLSIVDDTRKLHDASAIWGEGVFDSCKMVKESLGDQKARIAVIGPAGENLVKEAAIMTDERRAFGRTGVGAVMGSKLLKAIAVLGSKKVVVEDEKKLSELNKKYLIGAPTTSRSGGL